MKRISGRKKTALVVVAGVWMAGAAAMAQDAQPGGEPVHVPIVVHVKGDAALALTPDMLQVKVGRKMTPVTGLQPAQGVELAFVIDDSLRASSANQWSEVRAFFDSLPPGVQLFVGYMEEGTVKAATPGFTTDREVADKTLHIPMGVPGGNASPYFCLSDLVQHWPSRETGKARIVMMITNGVDNYYTTNPLDETSPYVDKAISDSQKAGVMVYSIYSGDAGVGGARADTSGQNYLIKVADATGGQEYYQGMGNPVSFRPFLEQFRTELQHVWELRFDVAGGGTQSLKVGSTQKGVKISSPDTLYLGQ